MFQFVYDLFQWLCGLASPCGLYFSPLAPHSCCHIWTLFLSETVSFPKSKNQGFHCLDYLYLAISFTSYFHYIVTGHEFLPAFLPFCNNFGFHSHSPFCYTCWAECQQWWRGAHQVYTFFPSPPSACQGEQTRVNHSHLKKQRSLWTLCRWFLSFLLFSPNPSF